MHESNSIQYYLYRAQALLFTFKLYVRIYLSDNSHTLKQEIFRALVFRQIYFLL